MTDIHIHLELSRGKYFLLLNLNAMFGGGESKNWGVRGVILLLEDYGMVME